MHRHWLITYDVADQILYMLVDERRSEEEVVAAGFEAGVVRGMNTRIRNNQFKRSLPIIAKISGRTIGADFLYLRDWGR